MVGGRALQKLGSIDRREKKHRLWWVCYFRRVRFAGAPAPRRPCATRASTARTGDKECAGRRLWRHRGTPQVRPPGRSRSASRSLFRSSLFEGPRPVTMSAALVPRRWHGSSISQLAKAWSFLKGRVPSCPAQADAALAQVAASLEKRKPGSGWQSVFTHHKEGGPQARGAPRKRDAPSRGCFLRTRLGRAALVARFAG
jgi:hypothetical protein